jgi:hypothetical protein
MGATEGKAAEPNAKAVELCTAWFGSLDRTPIKASAAESESCPEAPRFRAAVIRCCGLLEVLVRMSMAYLIYLFLIHKFWLYFYTEFITRDDFIKKYLTKL